MELFKANRQWSTRPADERFSSLADLHAACDGYRAQAAVATIPYRQLEARVDGDNVVIANRANGIHGGLTHWAFGQLAQRAQAPASYLRALPAPLAADCLNHGLQARRDDDTAAMLVHRNGSRLVRAFNSQDYTRIWNGDITRRLIQLEARGWHPAPAAYDGTRGLYASDHDLFCFMVDNERRIFERLPGGGLSRGFFVWNSEVGAASFGICTFLYAYVCGNHIVWDASDVKELRIRHVGRADQRVFGELAAHVREYANSSASDEEARIERARTVKLGHDKDTVLDAIFRLRVPALSQKRATEAYAIAEQHTDWYGDPRTVWGMANGITHAARTLPYADERTALDRAAGKVLAVASR